MGPRHQAGYTLERKHHGRKEEETEAVYRRRSREDHGTGADRSASRVSGGSQPQEKENGEAPAYATENAGRS